MTFCPLPYPFFLNWSNHTKYRVWFGFLVLSIGRCWSRTRTDIPSWDERLERILVWRTVEAMWCQDLEIRRSTDSMNNRLETITPLVVTI